MARLKNIEAFCSTCNTISKMEISGDVSGEENENKKWAKCKKCKQTMVIDADLSNAKVSLEGIEDSECTTYAPTKTFELGETIYHQNWDDFGKVVTKETLSNGRDSISVEFQKSGLKKLIESLKI